MSLEGFFFFLNQTAEHEHLNNASIKLPTTEVNQRVTSSNMRHIGHVRDYTSELWVDSLTGTHEKHWDMQLWLQKHDSLPSTPSQPAD